MIQITREIIISDPYLLVVEIKDGWAGGINPTELSPTGPGYMYTLSYLVRTYQENTHYKMSVLT